MFNRMPFSDHQTDGPFSNDGGFRLGGHTLSEKTSMDTPRNYFLSYNLDIFLYHVETR